MKIYTDHVGYWKKVYVLDSFDATVRLVRRLEKINRHPKWDAGYWYLGVSIKL